MSTAMATMMTATTIYRVSYTQPFGASTYFTDVEAARRDMISSLVNFGQATVMHELVDNGHSGAMVLGRPKHVDREMLVEKMKQIDLSDVVVDKR